MKKLNKQKTNEAYKRINSVSYHLANNCSDSPKEPEQKRKKYFEVQQLLRKAFLKYDSKTKLATAIQDLSKLDKYENAKTTYKAIWNDAPSIKKTARKSSKKVARI